MSENRVTTPFRRTEEVRKILVCAMNSAGRVVASMMVEADPDQVDLAREVMFVASPVVQEFLVQ